MIATVYLPQQSPMEVSTDGLRMPDASTGFALVPDEVSRLLDCAPGMVDVLASGPDYVAYSIFDYEGDVNPAAMAAVAEVSGTSFDSDDEDAVLQGPVLLVRRD
jgi:hypothetical protein